MTASFFPDVQHFGELIGDAGYSVSDNRRQGILQPGATARSRWIKRNGSALATLDETSTPAGLELRARSSASLPESLDELAVLDLGTPVIAWDASMGDPTNHGWTANGTFTGEQNGDWWRVITTATNQRYQIIDANLPFGGYNAVACRIRPVEGTQSQGIWPVFNTATNDNRQIQLRLTTGGTIQGIGSLTIPGFELGVTYVDLLMLARSSDNQSVEGSLLHGFYRVNSTLALNDTRDWAVVGSHLAANSSLTAAIYWGNVFSGANTYDWGGVAYWSGPEWVTPPTLPTRQFIQLEISNPTAEPITVTAIDLQSNAAAPPDVDAGPHAVVGTNAIAALAAAGEGNEVVRFDVIDDGDNVVDSWADVVVGGSAGLRPAPLPDGTYGVIATGMSDDGVSGQSSGPSDHITLPPEPPPTPVVAVTISPDELTAGQSAIAEAVLSGGAAATLNGEPWDGEAVEVVTAISNGTDPPGPVVYRLAQPPSRPVVRFTP